jgi:type I restriction enzyme R subunit
LVANERIYDRLTLGITVTEFIDGKKAQPTIAPAIPNLKF